MSFGFSVGDFIAVGKLVSDIVSCLQDSGGSKETYQELLRELDCLQKALVHLDKLSTGDPATLDSIKYAALICRSPLEEFLSKIRKYDTKLGVWAKPGVMKGSAAKLAWGFNQKKAAQELQIYLNRHVATINLLLAEHSLEKMDLASKEAASNQKTLRTILEDTREAVRHISGRFDIQAAVVRSTQHMLNGLCDMIKSDFATPWKSLGEMIARVCVTTQQTYTIMLEMKNTMAGPDIRWSYFQDPIAVEDALGYKYPVPSEYDFELFDAVVRHKFKDSPCSWQVQAGNYEYFATKDSSRTLNPTSRLIPGSEITMAIIIDVQIMSDEVCPMPHCRSQETTHFPGGGRKCYRCNVWFSPSKKPWKPLDNLVSAASSAQGNPPEEETPVINYSPRKRRRMTFEEDAYQILKNIRFSRDLEASDSIGDMDLVLPGEEQNTPETVEDPVNLSPVISDVKVEESLSFDEALGYVNKVKHRYLESPDKYQDFLEILQAYQKDSLPVQDVYPKLSVLFASDFDLIEDLERFMPKWSERAGNKRPQVKSIDDFENRGLAVQPGSASQRTTIDDDYDATISPMIDRRKRKR